MTKKTEREPGNSTSAIDNSLLPFEGLVPQGTGLVSILEELVSTSYIINLDDDVQQPFQYREISDTLRIMAEGDIACWNINTYGGDLYTTIMLINDIRACRGKNIGMITQGSSAGSIIGLALDDCNVVQHGDMFIHEIQSGNYGGTSDQEKRIKFMKAKQQSLMEDIYTGFLTPEEIEAIMTGGDLTLDATDCNARLEARRTLRGGTT